MTFHTAEFQQEFDAAQRLAQGEPDLALLDMVEPGSPRDADPLYADMSIEERHGWLNEHEQEEEEERRARAALFGPDAYWR